ncbi:hypothetical protein L7F22_040725 [Adiantum nelumboides]|nr:hypothetical protein [Adiantum nelumboides]
MLQMQTFIVIHRIADGCGCQLAPFQTFYRAWKDIWRHMKSLVKGCQRYTFKTERGRGGNIDFKRNFNCYKCGKYGHFAAQCLDPEEPTTLEAKQPEPVPVRAITRSVCVVIEELSVKEPVPSKMNPKAKEWEQSRSTWKEKGKAKEFDEWKDKRELATKITENLEKNKPEVLECSEA